MKKINKASIIILSIGLILAGSPAIFAATAPVLGATTSFSIVAQTAITGIATVSGDVGLNSTGAGITALSDGDVSGIIYSSDGVMPSTEILNPAIQANLSSANGGISSQSSTASIGPVLDGLIITPGVYDIGAGRLNSGILTLDGSGVYILRASSDLISSGLIQLINGARACDVYWQVTTLATINGSSFIGTIIAGTGVHFGNNVTLNGRALALGGDVTLLNNTISGPTCAAPVTPPAATPSAPATLHVIKTVINDNGGTAVASDFTLNVAGTNVSNSSFAGSETGVDITLDAGSYSVTEPVLPTGYLQSASNNCSGTIAAGETKTCTISNNDIAAVIPTSVNNNEMPVLPIVDVVKVLPLIHVTKVANPIQLPAGGGMVSYTNKVTNPGTVALSHILLSDDKCSPVKYISGDSNNNTKLDTTETWTYTCQQKIIKNTINTITAKGEANGFITKDFAAARVVVSTIPKLPSTGLPLNEGNTLWNILSLLAIFTIATLFYFVRKKQSA